MAKIIPITLVEENGLYVSEQKIYPRATSGRFQRLRYAAVWVLLGLYYLMAWLPWSGRQAVLWDLPARKFYVFDLVFWPQDFIFLAMLLIIAGVALFFFTALAGRLWCGYACPQTVWTEVFIWMERWAEGDRQQQIKLAAAPWSLNKLRRKLTKHTLWLTFALWTGFTFVGYFTPIRELAARTLPFAWSGWEIFWVLFYALATWGNAGFLREQVCKYMCPYARFQSAMFDHNTLVIAYDVKRGEARGARRKNSDPKAQNLGDCTDCTICVQVCPTGIDIRNGLQYECIACGACVDACDTVMDKMGYTKGLIRYTTENAIAGKASPVIRPRILLYGLLLLGLSTTLGLGVWLRSPLIVDVIRDKSLYRDTGDGKIENTYTLRLINKAESAHRVKVALKSREGIRIIGPNTEISLAPQEIRLLPLTLSTPYGTVKGGVKIEWVITRDDGNVTVHEKSRFLGPP